MGNRYGRNQKRAARRRIEELQIAHEMKNVLLRAATDKKIELELQLATCKSILGPEFVGFAPVIAAEMAVGEFEEPYWKSRCGDGHVRMHNLRIENFSDSHDPRHRVHCRVLLSDQVVGYSIAEPALRHVEAHILARLMAGELMQALIPMVQRSVRGSRRG